MCRLLSVWFIFATWPEQDFVPFRSFAIVHCVCVFCSFYPRVLEYLFSHMHILSAQIIDKYEDDDYDDIMQVSNYVGLVFCVVLWLSKLHGIMSITKVA